MEIRFPSSYWACQQHSSLCHGFHLVLRHCFPLGFPPPTPHSLFRLVCLELTDSPLPLTPEFRESRQLMPTGLALCFLPMWSLQPFQENSILILEGLSPQSASQPLRPPQAGAFSLTAERTILIPYPVGMNPELASSVDSGVDFCTSVKLTLN